MMRNNLMFKWLFALLLMLALQASVFAAPPCKGPNKNDPGCAPAVAPAVVDSVTVDWFNQELVVRGSGFTGSESFLLGSSTTPLAPVDGAGAPLVLGIPFNADVAAEVTSQGNYNLEVDGAVQLSVYIESQVIDPLATGCPCMPDWETALGALWGPLNTACLEIEGPPMNDVADISATILSDPVDGTVYPHYPISSSFYPGEPESSVCRLVQVNDDTTVVDLVNKRINEIQQVNCASELKANVCD